MTTSSAQAAARYQIRLEEAVNQLRVLGVYTPEYLEALKTAVVNGMSPQNIEHARLHRPTQPAPAGVIDRETIAKAINPRPWSERFMPFRCHGDDRTTEQLVEAERDRVRQTADAVLAVLPTRTVAQVKAEGVREAAAAWDATHQTFLGGNPQTWLNARADELEREDGR